MSTLINLVIGFLMAILFGQQIEEPKTVHHDFQTDTIKVFENLEARQHMLET